MNKKKLIYHYPYVEQVSCMPIGVKLSQIGTLIEVDSDGVVLPFVEEPVIDINKFFVKDVVVYSILSKPVSKIFKIKNNGKI